jgi:hypothetical protein
MKRYIFGLAIVLVSVLAFSWTGIADAAPNKLLDALKQMDRNVCQSFKLTCKNKPKATTKKRRAASPEKPAPAPPPKKFGPKPDTAKPTPKPDPVKPRLKPDSAKPTSTLNLNDVLIEPPPAQVKVIPLPRRKPQKPAAVVSPPPVVVPSVPAAQIEPIGQADGACLKSLRSQGVEFFIATDASDKGQCHVQNPVHLKSVKVQNNMIGLPEEPLLNCKYALQFSRWLRESAAPIAAAQNYASLEKVSTGPGYECRGRNGDISAKISEHGRGNAVDISSISFRDGKVIDVADALDSKSSSYGILRELRSSACGYFTTVLGPGSNEAHARHFHFDLGTHGKSGTYRICE